MVDCGDCWVDDTFHGCKFTSDECLHATGLQEDSDKIVKIRNWGHKHITWNNDMALEFWDIINKSLFKEKPDIYRGMEEKAI